MFFHIFINRIKMNLRSKEMLIWSVVFSLALGTLFYVAFSSIYDSDKNTSIPVALVEGDLFSTIAEFDLSNEPELAGVELPKNTSFEEILGDLKYEDGTKMLAVKSVSVEKAKKLLKSEKVDGIIDVRDIRDIKLMVSESGIHQSILTSVVSVFRQYSALIVETILHNPSDVKEALSGLNEEISLVSEKSLSGDNKDPYVAYFYSLIAMMCMMASMAGLEVPTSCQANLSDVGARVNVSPMNKGTYEFAGLAAAVLTQTAITMIGLTYFIYGLQINFGGNTGYIYLTAALGTGLGVALGFFIGHIGTMTYKTKNSILTVVIVGGGFLSGLMFGQMKVLIEKNMPIINRINPSSVLTDAFYSLNMFGVSGRYYRSVLYTIILTVVFIVAGLLMSRRKSYASL